MPAKAKNKTKNYKKMRTKTIQYKTVTFETVLFEFTEPLIALFKSGKTFFVASALPSKVGYVEEYLLVSASPQVLKRYFRNENDLRYLFVSARNRTFWKMPASEFGKNSARVRKFEADITEEMLPEAQFFASSHTHSFHEMELRYSALETLFIDGNWEMEDFGTFSRGYRDLYAFEESINKLQAKDTPAIEKDKISKAFGGNSLQGGGSYVNLFGDLLNNLPKAERYDLKEVQYASPGHIKLQGKGSVFDSLENRMKNMVTNSHTLHKKYWTLRKLMSESKLLDISTPVKRVSKPIADRIELDSKEVFKALDLDLYDTVYRLTGNNVVSTAKVAMAIYRRIKQASLYFAEGRVAFER